MGASVDCHPTAVVGEGVELGEGVVIGPYAIVHDKVRIGAGTHLEAHAVIEEHTTLGAECRVFPHTCIGTIPQDLKFRGEVSYLEIGDRNVFVAHDCLVKDHVIFGNAATLAGHVTIEDWAIVSAFSGVQQFCRVGRHAFVAAYSGVTKDAVPYATVQGMHARTYGLNTVGLRRRGFSNEVLGELKRAFRLLFRSNLNTSQAIDAIANENFGSSEIATLVEFVRSSEHGIVK